MSPERYRRLRSLFLAVCDRPAAEQAAVAGALSDEGLRDELLALLREHGAAEGRNRFPAGTVLAGRYRVVVPLGAGGMGEVYRADDLTLGQPVALKFLNRLGGMDDLAGLRHEVRVAREVTHANVCRVFDLVEGAEEPFLTMELVEGGSLADLVRRIGRLPAEKALDIARQLCEGLAAIHARGLLHRDLKPGNVLLDDRGRVRIDDFGLAGPAGAGPAAGTPAYMAPELLAGGTASVQSDLYALGLVLCEVFTGRPAFSQREQKPAGPAHPSTWVDLDPRVERAVLRCLEADPGRRPASVRAVAAALPGGDPLAAALAAGETPDPNLVAAAGEGGTLPSRQARLVLAGVLAGLALIVLLADRTLVVSQAPLPRSPAVLADRAQEVLRTLAPAGTVLDRAQGLACDEAYLRQVLGKRRGGASAQALARFWYRESSRWMVSRDLVGMIALNEPSRFQPGMRTVQLDGAGRLVQLELVPEERPAPTTVNPQALDALFRAAGLDRGRFRSTEPALIPPLYADARLAWTGSDPARPEMALRVEAATLAGRPVFFAVREPWQDAEPDPPSTLAGWLGEPFAHLAFQVLFFVVLLAAAVWLAVRNVRAGRGDRHGARWLGGLVFATGLGGWLLAAHHLPSLTQEFSLFLEALGRNLASAALVWVFYLALEPEVRRIRPQAEISWARLLAGRWRDPLVASHVLLGGLAGVAGILVVQAERLAAVSLDLPLFFPEAVPMLPLLGRERPPATILLQVPDLLLQALLVLLALVLFQRLLRSGFLAGLALMALVTLAVVDWQRASLMTWTAQALGVALVVLALARWGLLAALATFFFQSVLSFLPITRHLGAWYAGGTLMALGLLAALAVAGYVLAVGKASGARAT